jgi:hypothetical protein
MESLERFALLDALCKNCSEIRQTPDEPELYLLAQALTSDGSSDALIALVEKGGWGAWRLPPSWTLLVQHEFERRRVPFSESAQNFLALASQHPTKY